MLDVQCWKFGWVASLEPVPGTDPGPQAKEMEITVLSEADNLNKNEVFIELWS